MGNSETKNLEAISKAIDQHNKNCDFPASMIYMNPFEIERLDWPEIKGVPIRPDPNLQTGRFRIVCDKDDANLGEIITKDEEFVGAY
jgi:hypothetical protein